ncbi:YIP1 family protein [Flavobacterium sp. Fl-77]|uniref:YIP1 family protein n=1 Tax=Flavobacterium flavipigmentatum TaxID=2893884 RepID=A0AAJ2SA04_9FLAO|nr:MULTISPECIES: YIP1 family protein [unclassified Flavobacterium]MDX6180970.1 YIP1 family protein [Flavobacterium sp. Fl-33]MDX6184571.1 YIP1 family protein [Flavobacterium sp. Fl-77]UFH39676.1 YIP1 family protein [Flavobacterium sp. F-70]
MNWKFLFNPFSKFSEKQLFITGVLYFIINFFTCFFTKIQMDSLFHFTENENLSLTSAFLLVTISNVSAIIFLFLLALIINKKTRFIDITNTILISQAPNFLILLCIKITSMNSLAKNLKTNAEAANTLKINPLELLPLVFCMLILLAIIIYGFVLIYNGFKTATNFKKWQHIALFVVVLFFFILFHQVYIQNLNL